MGCEDSFIHVPTGADVKFLLKNLCIRISIFFIVSISATGCSYSVENWNSLYYGFCVHPQGYALSTFLSLTVKYYF